MATRTVLVVIVLVAIGCALLLIKAAGREPSSYAPVPQAAFTPILPQPSILPVYPAPLAWSLPVLPITFPGPTDKPRPKPRPKPQPEPPSKPNIVGRAIRGVATWYCLPSWPSKCMKVHPNPRGMYAAAGPALRAALGRAWRNHLVKVTNLANGRSVWVRLADWCACGQGHTIDLYSGPFAMLSGRSFSSPGGGLEVKISW